MSENRETLPESRCLVVGENRSVLYDGKFKQEFVEGPPTPQARDRMNAIRAGLRGRFLDKIIEDVKANGSVPELDNATQKLLVGLVSGLTSEHGRALVALSILQLSVKCIAPGQSIRLHKGGNRGGNTFSWEEGISMRTLDTDYITPTLRRHGLLKLNKWGFMMTRSLAENYPYSSFYKAAIMGPRAQWLTLVDLLEKNAVENPEAALRFLIALLINRSEAFVTLADETVAMAKKLASLSPSMSQVQETILGFVYSSSHAARVFEVAMHALLQVLEDKGVLGGRLRPMTQMRSANKKHGNVGDVEVVRGNTIIEAWDAKYGKSYLRDELEELADKLGHSPTTEAAGFVTDAAPDLRKEILDRRDEIAAEFGTVVEILSMDEWVDRQTAKVADVGDGSNDLPGLWLVALAESVGQKRRTRAPIDEPCDLWLDELMVAFRKLFDQMTAPKK